MRNMKVFYALSRRKNKANSKPITGFWPESLNIRIRPDKLLSIRLSGEVEQKAILEILDWRNDHDRAKNHATKGDIETYVLPVGDSRGGSAALYRAIRSGLAGEGRSQIL